MPGQRWTVHWVGGGDKGKDVVIAPTQKDAVARWIRDKGDERKFFLRVERTQLANA